MKTFRFDIPYEVPEDCVISEETPDYFGNPGYSDDCNSAFWDHINAEMAKIDPDIADAFLDEEHISPSFPQITVHVTSERNAERAMEQVNGCCLQDVGDLY